jgi:mRNA-degrading endonuclease YafQ of YafQ-DinJ toxin-antitoxin module
MNFDVRTIPEFERHFKRLAKKYSSIKQDLQGLVNELRAKARPWAKAATRSE